MNGYLNAMKKYAVFQGRARRSEYWLFFLFFIIIYVVAALLDGALGMLDPAAGIGLFSGIVILAHVLPSIAVGVRRIHDFDTSGWLYLIGLIPLVGTIFLIVIGCIGGTRGPNRFGPDPKDPMGEHDVGAFGQQGGYAYEPQGGPQAGNRARPAPQPQAAYGDPRAHARTDLSSDDAKLDKLQRLGELKAQGVLSEEEFIKAKHDVMTSNTLGR